MNPLNYLYEAIGWVFTHIYDVLKPVFGPTSGWTWALSIVILVVLMRLVMVPLFIKQMHHQGYVVPPAADGRAAQEVQER